MTKVSGSFCRLSGFWLNQVMLCRQCEGIRGLKEGSNTLVPSKAGLDGDTPRCLQSDPRSFVAPETNKSC
eukprot:416125-Heterocapsa_arctica.AAC.1